MIKGNNVKSRSPASGWGRTRCVGVVSTDIATEEAEGPCFMSPMTTGHRVFRGCLYFLSVFVHSWNGGRWVCLLTVTTELDLVIVVEDLITIRLRQSVLTPHCTSVFWEQQPLPSRLWARPGITDWVLRLLACYWRPLLGHRCSVGRRVCWPLFPWCQARCPGLTGLE